MTPAMYFGIKYAVNHVGSDPDLAGLLITGTGDVFAPGGDMGGGGVDNWLTFGSALGMDAMPFDTCVSRPSRWWPPSTGCVRAAACRSHCAPTWRWSVSGHLPGARAVPRNRRHLLQPDAGPADRSGPHPRPDVHRPHPDRRGGAGLGHGRPGGAARRAAGCGPRGARPMLPHRTRRPVGGQGQHRQLPGALRPDRHATQPWLAGVHRGLHGIQGSALPEWVHPTCGSTAGSRSAVPWVGWHPIK